MLRTQHLIHSLCNILLFERSVRFLSTTISTSSSILNFCTKPQHLQQIHARFFLHGLHQNSPLSSKLIDCYANFGLINFSLKIFHFAKNPDSVLYGAVLRNLSQFSGHEKTLLIYKEMVEKSICPDEESFLFVLRSCFSLSHEQGRMVHGQIVKLGLDSFDLVCNTLIELYDDMGDHEPVERNYLVELNYWNKLISEASESGKLDESFKLFSKMIKENIQPNSFTVINLLRLAVNLNSLKIGQALHSLVVRNLCEELSVNTAMLLMYVKLGSLEDAELLFDKMPEKDLVVWNVMISAYAGNGYPKESLELLYCMVRLKVRPDLFTAIPAISSITQLKNFECGRQIHAHVIRNGSDYQVSVQNSLIDMYSACDNLSSSRKIFDNMMDRTVVSWSALIKGYVMHDQCLEALSLFLKMKLSGTRVDFIIVINILPAFAKMGVLHYVRYLHGYSLKASIDSLKSVKTSFLSSYAKCGCIVMARKLFDEEKSSHKDLIAWNSMINAYSKHGEWFRCFQLYNQMKLSNIIPDKVTFLGLLTACVNSGLVDKGKEIFREMVEIYGYQPSQEHHACMVDLLGRAGQIDKASEIIDAIPFKPDARVYGPLLSACKLHSETHFAEVAAQKLINIEPKNAGNYVLLSNIYAAAGKWEKVAEMRSFLRDRGLKKTPGCSWLELHGQTLPLRTLVYEENHLCTKQGTLLAPLQEVQVYFFNRVTPVFVVPPLVFDIGVGIVFVVPPLVFDIGVGIEVVSVDMATCFLVESSPNKLHVF
ncbi:pentatricopeptide repeat-containing protein At1g11290, chloroplastic-like [Arachis ipaensis]|uniref:pentatricopeptide repeat-containing protein At1g11290, chloroplastic-like n=1 Tax=Arachis ipaensis TaxID=130454 RepID=UPI0007AF0EE6|nr:pentatricopeptide repeat-containing protein At1g11290, chloroplastic-like [Arachis ipaensis]